jgi:polyisoprenoid-binding protein YceI
LAWTLDLARSRIGFAVRHMVVSTVRGRFAGYRAALQLDADDFTRSSAEATIDVASVDTGNAERDAYLRTSPFLDPARHPTITYKSTRVEPRGGRRYRVHGELTIRGTTRPLVLEVEYSPSRGAGGRASARLVASGALRRQDFGLDFGALLETGGVAVGDEVKLELDVTASEAG